MSSLCASTCSPSAPIASEEIVTPSCIAEMNRGGSPVIRMTARARLLPSCSSSMIRVRRDVTRPYSAATKNPFRRSRPTRASICRRKVIYAAPLVGARLLGGRSSSTRDQCRASIARRGRHERMFYTAGMRVDYREEPCKVALNRVKGMPFDWSLNPYMGCVHRCTFCYVRAFERRADRPVGRPLRHVDPRQGQHRRGAAGPARASVVATARRSRSARRPTRTSPPRAATA